MALPQAEVIERPLADGGPGTATIIAAATGARMVETMVTGAYGESVRAAFAFDESGRVAVIEAASAVGLALVRPAQRSPALSTSTGVGELLLTAAEHGATRIIVGIGGTASSDGGAGAAAALGLRLLDARGAVLPPGGLHLVRLARVEQAGTALTDLDVRIAVDVLNPLTGPEGAAAIFGAQKGLRDWQAPALDAAVRCWADRVQEDLGRDIASLPGTGAGGGIGAGILAAVPHARIEPGAALVGEAIGLQALIAGADLVVTGEGALDAQTGYGKTVAHVVALAGAARVPCLAVAGVVEARPAGIVDVEALTLGEGDEAQAMRDAAARAEGAARRLVERWQTGATG